MTTIIAMPADLDQVVVPPFSGKYVRVQGPASGEGRTFAVTGPKADVIRRLAIRGGFTRKQIADLAGASVSRVAEVLWGLDHDGIAYSVARKAAPAPSQADVDAAILADAAE